MSVQAQTAFKVGTLDLTGIETTNSTESKARYLYKPGTYNFTIVEAKLYQTDKMKDGAGHAWGSVRLVVENEEGYRMASFIQVPIDSLLHTSKSGRQSMIPTQILASLIAAASNESVKLTNIGSLIENLHNILAPGKTFKATVETDKGARLKRAENGSGYNLVAENDSLIVDVDGQALAFADIDSAKSYGRANKVKISDGLRFKRFLREQG